MSMTRHSCAGPSRKRSHMAIGKPRQPRLLFLSGPQIGCSSGGAFQGSVNSQCAIVAELVKKSRRASYEINQQDQCAPANEPNEQTFS